MRETATAAADRFLALLQPIERDLETYARRLIWESQEAPDAIQNAVLRAFAAFDRYHEHASFRAWMFKILTNEAFAPNPKPGACSPPRVSPRTGEISGAALRRRAGREAQPACLARSLECGA